MSGFDLYEVTGGMSPDEIGGSLLSRGLSNRIRKSPDAATITMGSAGGASVIPSSVRYYPALKSGAPDIKSDPCFTYNGIPEGSLETAGSDTVHGKLFTGASPASTTGYWIPSISFEYTGSEFEVQLRTPATSDAYYRIFVNSEPLNDFTLFAGSAGASHKLHVDFSTASARTIEVRFYGCDFGGVICEPNFRPIKSAPYSRPVALFISNSICAGYSVDSSRWSTWPAYICDLLDMQLVNASIGGTGYIAAPTYADRLSDLDGIYPDVVFYGDHYNDLSSTTEEINVAIAELSSAIKTKWPSAKLFIINGWSVNETLSSRQIEVASFVRDHATAIGAGVVDYTDHAGVWSETLDWTEGVSYLQGETARYEGVIYECYADHTGGSSINLSGFRPSKIITASNNAALMLADGIHPKNSTSEYFGAAFARSIV